jgi:hypothetical protein
MTLPIVSVLPSLVVSSTELIYISADERLTASVTLASIIT